VIINPRPIPVFHYPTYPSYPTYPAGPCTIYSNNAYDSLYTVTNAYGQNIGTTYDYSQATLIAQNALNARQCSYVTTITNNNTMPNFCQIIPVGNTYRVIDNHGMILVDACDYNQAQNQVQSDSRCYVQ
jgi:hypothetical protein